MLSGRAPQSTEKQALCALPFSSLLHSRAQQVIDQLGKVDRAARAGGSHLGHYCHGPQRQSSREPDHHGNAAQGREQDGTPELTSFPARLRTIRLYEVVCS
jgi:hypothetical protein